MKIKHPRTLGRLEAMLNKIGGDDGLDLLLADQLILVDPAKQKKNVRVESNPLLTFVGTFKAPGAKEFVAAKNYVVDTSERARVRISYLGDNFKKTMLPKVERDVAERDLTLSKLTRYQHDLPMSDEEPGTIAGLGGLSKAETTLCEFYETLAHKQTIRDFTWTVGYIRDKDGMLSTVYAYWHGDGWGVGACSVSSPDSWNAGSEFVSR